VIDKAVWFVLFVLDACVLCPLTSLIAGAVYACGCYADDVQFAWRRRL